MMPSEDDTDHEDLELARFTDEMDQDDEDENAMDSAPDSPLLAPTDTRPKWLTDRRTRRKWGVGRYMAPLAAWLLVRLRPRLSWRYVLSATLALYISYCLVTGSPLLASKLPGYTGEHGVGAIDLEVALEKPVRISDTALRGTSPSEPAFEVETVLFTLYYPASKHTRSKRPRHRWIPRPISLTAAGYAKIAHVDNFIMRPIFTFALWAIGGSIEIPSEVDVPLLRSGSDHEEPDDTKFPVMVFSHGSASSRTDYTNYLGELASRGHVVAALEHRDGSCPGSVVKIKSKKDRNVGPLLEDDLKSDPPMNDAKLKVEQLAFREVEIFEAIRVLQAVNEGKGKDIYATNPRGEGSSLDLWKSRLDLQRLTIAGHSYGATGALQALKNASAPSPTTITGGIALDPGKSSGPLNPSIPVPLLVVHSNSWSRTHSPFFGRPHFDTVRDIVLEALNRTSMAWFLTSIGTSHPSVTDAPLLEPLALRWTTGATVDVKEGLEEYVRVAKEFMDVVEGQKNASGVLAEAVTHEEYGEWVSDERKKNFPKDMAKRWEIHVTPAKGH